ncbi:hypothetical protein M2451_004104 [Dysgonomonas sp. PFB1-18]|uniref:hypothetical protein n=1 Tax=unclassified Dysgonomonas TaxID=2630389 RepID=UPI00247519F8|nr:MULTISPECIES: hypothetical protein [unclassified Dysgonomonas]MDH6311173.1 hypothetical protein [Dysgonomonas sp. PF1-14]MDH6341057.1 hypothetical protein [Dysgonomonas sp. PF1-16]MDH6382754.1 hypothetical protein [Dysgonomonas sp. PFB1-18]MDH6400045.1 hypothetical protein [Dysgonomonas sp. PF1-23]
MTSNTVQIEQLPLSKDTFQEEYITALYFCCFDYMLGNLCEDDLYADKNFPYIDFLNFYSDDSNIRKLAPYLYVHCRIQKEMSGSLVKSSEEKDKEKEVVAYEKELTKALLPFFTPKYSESVKIKIINSLDDATITNNTLPLLIKDTLLNEYKAKCYHHKPITINEARRILNSNSDPQWVEDYKSRWNVRLSMRHREFEVDDVVIEEYAAFHFEEEDINYNYLKNKFGQLQNTSKGALATNDTLAQFAERIFYFICYNRFLEQDQYDDIEQLPITDNESVFIAKCLSYFQLMDGRNAGTDNSLRNYIRMIIKQYRQSRKDMYSHAKHRDTEKHLNRIRKYLRADKTYYIDFCHFWDVKLIDYTYWDVK